MKWEPLDYHRRAVAFALRNPRAQLWLDKGLGKTAIAGTVIAELMDRGRISRVLVVATRRICRNVWPVEFEKWDHLQGIPVRYIDGPAKRRAKLLAQPWVGVETITYENLRWLLRDYLVRGEPLPWDMVVFDEVSKLKAPGTQRFRALRSWVSHLPRTLHLTGSPAPSGLLNVWAPTFVLDRGKRLGNTYGGYKTRWFTPHFLGYRWDTRPGAEREITERVADITLSMRSKDYLDLPPLVTNTVWVDLPPTAREVYKELERQMYAELARGSVEAANGGVLTSKCRQIANGFVYVPEIIETGGEPRRCNRVERLHDAKIEALREVVDEAQGQNIIVAYTFRADLEAIRAAFPRAAVLDGGDDRQLVAEWNAGRHSMLVLHPASAGHGLNLQEGGAHMAFVGCPWSFDQYDQCRDRIAGGLRRQRPTFIHHILCRGTVDAAVAEALDRNCQVQEVLKEYAAKAR